MLKKISIIMTVFILSVVLLGAQPATAASSANNLHPTHINLNVYYSYNPFHYIDPVHNPYSAEVEAGLVDETTGKKLSGRHIKFELISPEYGISEVQYHTTSKLFLLRYLATAYFEGPFTSGVWKVRASYGGNSKDHLAPCVAYIDLKKA